MTKEHNVIRVFGCSIAFETVEGLVQSEAMKIFPITTVLRKKLCQRLILRASTRLIPQYAGSVYESKHSFQNDPTFTAIFYKIPS